MVRLRWGGGEGVGEIKKQTTKGRLASVDSISQLLALSAVVRS